MTPWLVISAVGGYWIFFLGLVALTLAFRRPQPGDEVIVKAFPPRIEIRPASAAGSGDPPPGVEPTARRRWRGLRQS